MGIVSRLKLDHPALGTVGGASLHAAIEALFVKLGDMTNSRYFIADNLNDAASTDFEHNFQCAFDELKVILYSHNEGTGELTRIVSGGTPDLDDFTIVATPSFETTKVRVTNGTGSQQDIAAVIVQGDFAESLGELDDVDLSTPAEDGQSIVWDSATSKFKPGASGDSSFKFQSIAGSDLTIKQGFLVLDDGRELYAASDLTVDLSSYGNGDYYGSIDLFSLPAATLVDGRELIEVDETNFVFSTTVPRLSNLSRYIPRGYVRKAGGVWTVVKTLAFLRHGNPIATDTSLEFSQSQAVGAVGDASQINAGHVLTQNSFPSAAYAATSFFNLVNANDGNAALAHNLTNNGTVLFDQVGIMGVDDQCPSLNGTTQFLNSLDTHFDPGDADFSCGWWVKPTSWVTGTQTLFGQWASAGSKAFLVQLVSGILTLSASVDGTAVTTAQYDVSAYIGWHHIGLKYVASTNTLTILVDGSDAFDLVLSSGLKAVGASRNFAIGKNVSGTDWLAGLVDEFFFCNGTAFSDDDFAKIYSAKISHNRSLTPSQQDWKISAAFGGIERDIEADVIVDKDTNDLYVDLSSLPSTATVAMKMNARGAVGSAIAARSRLIEGTATELDTLIGTGVSFGFPSMIQSCSLFVETPTPDQFETVSDTTAFLKFESVSPFRLLPATTTLATAFGGTAKVKLVVSTGGESVAFPLSTTWNTSVVAASTAIANNDRILANPTGTLNLTLPSSPRLGDTVKVIDFDGTWSGTDKVVILRNGNKIHGILDDLQLDVAGDKVELVFNGTDDWRII